MRSALRNSLFLIAAAAFGLNAEAVRAQGTTDNDNTLRAMRDEMARSKDRLELTIDKTGKPVRPFYIEYRLLDLDVREISATKDSEDLSVQRDRWESIETTILCDRTCGSLQTKRSRKPWKRIRGSKRI